VIQKTTSQDALQSAIVRQARCFHPPKNRVKQVLRHTPSNLQEAYPTLSPIPLIFKKRRRSLLRTSYVKLRVYRKEESVKIKIIVLVVYLLLIVHGGTALAANPSNQVEQFLTAVQKKDFKIIFDTSYYYQMELSQIKSNNPKALWSKLTTEYYESKKNALFKQKEESLTDAWIRFGGEMFGTPTDPTENIRALMGLLLPSPKLKVIESKKEKHLDQWSGRQSDVYVVYVSLSYKTVEESPLIGSNVLKEAILGFILDAKSGLYMRSSKVGKGDVYWGGDPSTDVRIALRLANHGLLNDSISILEGLQGKGTLNNEGKMRLAAVYFERVQKKGIVKYSGYYGFDKYTNYNWRQDIDKAIAVSPTIRNEWINFLVRVMEINLNSEFGRYSDGEGTVINIAKVATEYSKGYSELENMVHKPQFDLASIFINWASHKRDQYFFLKYLNYALTVLPDDPDLKQKALKEAIQPYLTALMEMREDERFIKMGEIEEIINYVIKRKFALESVETVLFSKSASYIASCYELSFQRFPRSKEYREKALYWKQKAEEWQ